MVSVVKESGVQKTKVGEVAGAGRGVHACYLPFGGCMPRAATTLVTRRMGVPTVHGRRLFLQKEHVEVGRFPQVCTAAVEMGGKRGSSAMAIWATVLLALLFPALLSARAADRGIMRALEICNMDAEKLTDCLPAVRGPAPAAPSVSCCAALRAADLPCFCRYKDSVILGSMGIDPNLAATLPDKCSIELPPECSGEP